MANPPFNVDGVQVAKIKSQVGDNQTGRLPFGLPGIATKTKGKNNGEGETISNANSLWIQYFYSYLNDTGRAGFVMASSASDAGNKDKDIRQKLVESGHVDVMMSIGPKFFYTRSLPCTLWFFDKGKPEDLLDTVLMIDARNVYTVVSARSHVFSEEQLANLTAITWLYRGEHDRFTALLASYHTKAGQYLATLPERLAADELHVKALASALRDFAKATEDDTAVSAVREKLGDKDGEGHGITDEALAHFRTELAKLELQAASWDNTLAQSLKDAKPLHEAIAALPDDASFAQRKDLHNQLDKANPNLKTALAALEARHKGWLKLLELAEKSLRARQWAALDGDATRDAKKALLPRDAKKREKPTVRDMGVEAFKRASYFVAQSHWLLHRFPDGLYVDAPGLCKAASRQEIAGTDYSLTPGRYVGLAQVTTGDDDGDIFTSRMLEIQAELLELNTKATELAEQIGENFLELLG
jgi:type I restriction enzyme M protein